MAAQMIRFSGKHDPEVWMPRGQIGIAGLKVRLVPNMRVAEFYRGGRRVRVSVRQLLAFGEKWATRKIIRFRRYARRMERQEV